MCTGKWGGKLLTKAGQGLKKDDMAAEPTVTRQSWHRFCEVQLPESRFQKLSVPRHWSRKGEYSEADSALGMQSGGKTGTKRTENFSAGSSFLACARQTLP